MIITVQGTQKGDHNAARMLAALSYFGVARDQKSTLVIQFVNKTEDCVENYLIGKSLRNESLIQDASLTDISTGVDALLLHSNSGNLKAEIFSDCVRKLVNVDNMYDIATVSNKTSFERELSDREIKARKNRDESEPGYIEDFLNMCSGVYKYVFVLLPSKNKKLCDMVLPFADVNLICIGQGRKEPVNLCAKKNYYVITDYDNGSMYNDKSLMKDYGANVIFGMLYNIGFHDACAEGTLVTYMQHNIDDKKTDVNYNFIHYMELLYNSIAGKKGGKKEGFDADEAVAKKDDGIRFETVEWMPVDPEAIVVKIEKSGLIKKREYQSVRILDEDNDAVVKQVSYITEEPAKETEDTDPEEGMFIDRDLIESELGEAGILGKNNDMDIPEDPDDEISEDDDDSEKNELDAMIAGSIPEEISEEEISETPAVEETHGEKLEPIPGDEDIEEPKKKGLFGLFGGFGKKKKDAEEPVENDSFGATEEIELPMEESASDEAEEDIPDDELEKMMEEDLKENGDIIPDEPQEEEPVSVELSEAELFAEENADGEEIEAEKDDNDEDSWLSEEEPSEEPNIPDSDISSVKELDFDIADRKDDTTDNSDDEDEWELV